MTQSQYVRRKRRIEQHNQDIQQRADLRKLKVHPGRRKLETNKLIAFYLFIVFNVIIIYALVAMWKHGDFSYLGVLISDIAAQVLVYAIYCIKAYCGKKAEENLRFERDKLIIASEGQSLDDTNEIPTDASVG